MDNKTREARIVQISAIVVSNKYIEVCLQFHEFKRV